MGKSGGFKILRELYRALRGGRARVIDEPIWEYAVELSRKLSSGPLTLETKSLRTIGTAYVTHLKASRSHTDLVAKYKGKGEFSTEEAADRMGFKLPQYGEKNPNRMSMGRKY